MNNKEWGLRWEKVNRRDQVVGAEKWFTSKEAREKFADKLVERDDFIGFVAISDPREVN